MRPEHEAHALNEVAVAPATDPDGAAPAPLTAGWLAAAWALVAGAVALGVGGFVNSFAAVRDAVEPSFGGLDWTVPVLIDVGVAVFTGIDLLFTRLRMRLWWLRLVPWSLVAATVWLNVADESTSVGVVAHGAPPVLWVVTVELAAHAMRSRTGLETEQATRRSSGRMDRVRLSRWLLAPWSTLVIRRWMVLQEERSYERANARWWDRKQAKWELQDTYGAVLWRLRAPRRERGLYRWGHLTPSAPAASTPTGERPPPGPGPVPSGPGGKRQADEDGDRLARENGRRQAGENGTPSTGRNGERQAGENGTPRTATNGERQAGRSGTLSTGRNGERHAGGNGTRRPGPIGKRRTGVGGNRPGRGRRRRGTFADFATAAAQLAAEGLPVNRTLVARRLREAGLSLANDRADEYLTRLEASKEASPAA